VLASRSTYF
jgi:hypothetical protein